jgi:hypothetical protein
LLFSFITDSTYVTIRGARVSDNGYIQFDSIGEGKESEAVLCHTDDPACCTKDQANYSNWYYPNGNIVESYMINKERGGSDHSFARRREPSVVLLYRIKNNNPRERGRFCCEIRDAAGSNHRLHVNICKFSSSRVSWSMHACTHELQLYAIVLYAVDIGTVSVTRQNLGNTTNSLRELINLTCSAEIYHNPLPENVPYPSFEWFFGQPNSSLPSDVTVSNVTGGGNNYTYSSILQFSPLRSHHAGKYTCRLGGNERLSANITVEGSTHAGT